jgi:glycosyltransferase involved in cell wall biosynthesis
VNPEVVIEGQTGFCVSDRSGWVEALDHLASDPGLRRRMGAAGRERIERYYSVAALAPRVADVLRRVIGARPD